MQTPRLLDHEAGADVVILLLTVHAPAEPATARDHDSWLAVARDLATLHATSARAAPWPSAGWLLDSVAAPDWARAVGFWGATGSQRGRSPRVQRAEGQPRSAHAALVPTLVHGDCHTDNLLRENGSLVWVDWQGVGVGNPAADLAFLSVRAAPSGAAPPSTRS